MPDEANEIQQPPEPETCDTCNNDVDYCTCWTCNGRRGHQVDSEQTSQCERCELCSDCCSCCHCDSCSEPCAYTCSNCDRCESCCGCTTCEACSEPVDRTCDNNLCENCCDDDCSCHADEGPRRKQQYGHRLASKTQFKRNTLQRMCGIELEIASIEDSDYLTNWQCNTGAGLVADGSIPDGGCEIVFRPTSGDVLLDDCESLGRALSNGKAKIDNSCGLHVHVDARDYTQADLRRLIILYASVEQVLFELVSRSRFDNHYCGPCGNKYLSWLAASNQWKNSSKDFSKAWRHNLNSSLYDSQNGRHTKSLKREKYHAARYSALNLHTYFYRKTVEFRLHEAHLSSDVIANWTLVCGCLNHTVDAA